MNKTVNFMIQKKHISLLLSLLTVAVSAQLNAGTPHLNLFNPYDVLVTPERAAACGFQASINYEYAFDGHSFQAEEDERGNSNCFRKRADILQLYQNQQDGLAALKGDVFNSIRGKISQEFNINDDDGSQGLFIPYGKFNVSNIMLSLRYGIDHRFSVSLHLPVLDMHLKNVNWKKAPGNSNQTFDDNLVTDFITELESAGKVHLFDWHRTGIGDLAGFVWWDQFFPQARPMLRGVNLNARIGFAFPTGKKAEGDYLFCPSFGNGGGISLIGGGKLELFFTHHIKAGIDVELTHTWGSREELHIKTDPAQTDLLLLDRSCVFKKPGFTQHFTLFLGAQNFYKRLSLITAYQFTKQDESQVYLPTATHNQNTANSAENLWDWTTHSFDIGISYDLRTYEKPKPWEPYFGLIFKHGFNGSRAVLMNSITGMVSFEF